MYTPAHFKEDRVHVLHETIRHIGIGTLITFGSCGLEASHIPMIIDSTSEPFGVLKGHLARANPQWRQLDQTIDALAIFAGPHAYITPSWYETKKQNGKVVPTWNYIAIHAYGRMEITEDKERLHALVEELTDTHEQSRSDPWAVSDAPENFMAGLLQGIVGFEMKITRLEGKWKMSQNQPRENRDGVRDGLIREQTERHTALAQAMRSDIKP